jgi:hypothetical protein
MRALRVIFLTSLLFLLGGGPFAENNRGGLSQGGKSYAAPDFDFSGPMKTELLLIVVGAALLLPRWRKGRAVSQTYGVAHGLRYMAKVREVGGKEAASENNRSSRRNAKSIVDFE